MQKNKQTKIYLPEKEELVKALCEVLFEDLMTRLSDDRAHDKIRIGMQILIKEKNYANQINLPILLISHEERDTFLACDYSGEVAELTFYLPGQTLEIVVDGLLANENIAIALIVMSRLTKMSLSKLMCLLRKNEFKLPSCLRRKGYYLQKFMEDYQ